MWELDYKESRVQKNWCFWSVVLEKTLEGLLDCKEIQPVHPTGDQSWVFIGRTDVEAEMPILWPPDVKSWLIGKYPDAGKDWGQEEMGTMEDEMVGWYHRLNGHGFGWTLGIGDGQEGLACYASWGRKESDTTEWLNWIERNRGGFVRFVQIGCWEHRSGRIKDAYRSLEVLDTEGRAQPFLHRRQGWLVGEELLKHPDGEWMPPESSDWSHLPKSNNWHMSPSSWTPSYLSLHSTPQGCHRALG